jgi:hypothetical protein
MARIDHRSPDRDDASMTCTDVRSPVPAVGRGRGLRAPLAVVLVFGAYGVATGARNTNLYLATVAVLGVIILRVGDGDVPPWLARSLAVTAGLHLAGGLVEIGDDVLYNASLDGGQLLRYDHLAHTVGSFIGTLTCWHLFRASGAVAAGSVSVWLLAGLGIGALNETLEFLSTMARDGGHVGGYVNTGWDLVCNVLGCVAAIVVIRRAES